MNDSTPTHQPEASAAAWQWRKRLNQGDYNGEPYYCWSEWEALQPPYMDARELSKSDPANYELRPLFLATQPPAAPAQVQFCPGCDMPQCRDAGRCAAPQPLEALAPAAPESFYVRFAKEWITASEDERQRISEWMTGWYGEPAAPVAAVGEAVPLTVVQYNAIPELCAIRPSLYESIVRAIERAHGILPAASMGAK